MKLITATKFYYHRAGLESYLFKVSDMLKSYGHDVIPFSTKYSENYKTDYDEYFAEYIGIGGEDKLTAIKKIKALTRIFYNAEARNKIARLMDKTTPDLLWGFGVHRHLSPSIFMEAKKRNIPVIHRLSDYAIICPDSRLTKGDNSNCEELLCPLKGYHNSIINRCVRQASNNNASKDPSIVASAIGAAELFFHNTFGFYKNNVDKFIAPSNCLKNVMIKAGIPEHKITHVPVFINHELYEPEYSNENYIVYVGRLSREKGLPLLLNSMKKLKNYKLKIVGDGPQREFLEEIKHQENIDNVEFMGKLFGDRLKQVVKGSKFMVIPSTWYENSPNVLLEAYAMGKPVLGAKIGGIPEYIEEAETGFSYKYDCQEELLEKIDFMMKDVDLCRKLGQNARNLVEKVYNPHVHYEKVMNVINSVGINN